MSDYTVKQLNFIAKYRAENDIPTVLTDDAVVEQIKEDMKKNGVVYPEFESLLETADKTKIGNKDTKTKKSVFGDGYIKPAENFDVIKLGNIKKKNNAPTEKNTVRKKIRIKNIEQKDSVIPADNLAVRQLKIENIKIEPEKTRTPMEKHSARQFIAAYLKEEINRTLQEFRIQANPMWLTDSRPMPAIGQELIQEFEDVAAKIVHKLHLGEAGIKEPENRVNLQKDIESYMRRIYELEAYVDNPAEFDKRYRQIMKKPLNFNNVLEYMEAAAKFNYSNMSNKLEILEKLKNPALKLQDAINTPIQQRLDKWANKTANLGGLTDFAITMAIMYYSGGTAAIAKAAQSTAKDVTATATSKLLKTGMKKNIAEGLGQAAGIEASKITSATANAAAFQGLNLAGTIGGGGLSMNSADVMAEGTWGLTKFGYIASSITGPLGMKFGQMVNNAIINKQTLSLIKSSTIKPTTLGTVLKTLVKNSNFATKTTELLSQFAMNAEYMAYDEGISYEEAVKNLAQMEGLSKMLMAMMSGKATSFLTDYKVSKVIHLGENVYKITRPNGKVDIIADDASLMLYMLDRLAAENGKSIPKDNGNSAGSVQKEKTTPAPAKPNKSSKNKTTEKKDEAKKTANRNQAKKTQQSKKKSEVKQTKEENHVLNAHEPRSNDIIADIDKAALKIHTPLINGGVSKVASSVTEPNTSHTLLQMPETNPAKLPRDLKTNPIRNKAEFKEYLEKETKKLNNNKLFFSSGTITERFSQSEIDALLKLYEKEPELILKLTVDYKLEFLKGTVPRFNYSEIENIYNLFKEYPESKEVILSALEIKSTSARTLFNEETPAFSSDDIIELVDLNRKYPDLISKLLKEKITEESLNRPLMLPGKNEGKTMTCNRFCEINDIQTIAETYALDKELTLKYLQKEMTVKAENGNNITKPRLNAKGINLMVKLELADKELADRIINEKNNSADNQNGGYRFGSRDLEQYIAKALFYENNILAKGTPIGTVRKERIPAFKKMLDLKNPNGKPYNAGDLHSIRFSDRNPDNFIKIVEFCIEYPINSSTFHKLVSKPLIAKRLFNILVNSNEPLTLDMLEPFFNAEEDLIKALETNAQFRKYISKAMKNIGANARITSPYVDSSYQIRSDGNSGDYTFNINSGTSKSDKDNITRIAYFKLDKNGGVTDLGIERIFYDSNNAKKSYRTYPDGSKIIQETKNKESENDIVEYKKVYLDSNNKQVKLEELAASPNKAGEYEITVHERSGNKFTKRTIGTVTKTENGYRTRLRVKSPSGKITKIINETNGNNSEFEYSIFDTESKTELYKIKRSFKKLDDNHFVSELNGQKYDMRFDKNGVKASKIDANGNATETVTLGYDVLDISIIDLFKQLPGDFFFKIKQCGIKRIECNPSIATKDNASFDYSKNEIYLSEELKNDAGVLAHELGHAIDHLKEIGNEADFVDIGDRELEQYKAVSTVIERNGAAYTTEKIRITRNATPQDERLADIHSVTSGLESSNRLIRDILLIQNFPESVAHGSERLEGTKPVSENKKWEKHHNNLIINTSGIKTNGAKDTTIQTANENRTTVDVDELSNWEELKENWANLPKQFDPVQMEILEKATFSDWYGSFNKAEFENLKRLLKIEELSADDVIELMTSHKVDKSEFENIEKYAKIAKENGLNLVDVMKSTEEEFNNYIRETALKTEHGLPIHAKEDWFVETDSRSHLFAQMKKFGGYSEWELKKAMKNFTKEEIKTLSKIMTIRTTESNWYGTEQWRYERVEDLVYAAKNLKQEDMQIFEYMRKSGCRIKSSVENINELVQNNPAKRAVMLELEKQRSEYFELIRKNGGNRNGNYSLINSGYVYEELKNIETAEQAEAYIYYLITTPLKDMHYTDNPPMNRIKNINDMKVWIDFNKQVFNGNYYGNRHIRDFKNLYISLNPKDRALIPISQIKDIINNHYDYDKLKTHTQIMAMLLDKGISPKVKDNIREFLALNPKTEMIYKWGLISRHLKPADRDIGLRIASYDVTPVWQEGFRRIIELDKTGIDYQSNYYKYNDAIEVRNGRYGELTFAMSDKEFNSQMDYMNNPQIKEKLGRSLTVDEAGMFARINENWKKEWALSHLKEGMNTEEIQKITDLVKFAHSGLQRIEQMQLADLILEYGYKIPTTDGEGCKFDNGIFERLYYKEDIDAFCRIVKKSPYDSKTAEFFYGISDSGFAKKLKIYEDNPNISKILLETPRNDRFTPLNVIIELFENTSIPENIRNMQKELFSELDKFAAKHPEFSEKLKMFAHYSDYGYTGNQIHRLNEPETLERIKKNLKMIDSLPKEDIEILAEVSDYTGYNTDFGFADVITNHELSREKYDIVKPLYLKNRQHKFTFNRDGVIELIIRDENDIDIMRKAAPRFYDEYSEFSQFLFHLRNTDKELTIMLLDNPEFTNEMIQDVTGKLSNRPPREDDNGYGTTLERVKELANAYKDKGITVKEAYLMMLNYENVDKNTARKILAKCAKEVTNKENIEEQQLSSAKLMAEKITPELKELQQILLDNPGFSTRRIRSITEQNSYWEKDWNVTENMPKALDIARNYKKMGLNADEAYLMLVNINHMTPRLAKSIWAKFALEQGNDFAESGGKDFIRKYIKKDNAPLAEVLFEDSNFSTKDIKDILGEDYEHGKYWNPVQELNKAVELVQNYKKLGYSYDEVYIMLSNISATDRNLALKILDKVSKEEIAKATKKAEEDAEKLAEYEKYGKKTSPLELQIKQLNEENNDTKPKKPEVKIDRAKIRRNSMNLARSIKPEAIELGNTLLDDANFSINDIQSILNSDNVQTPQQIQAALDIAKNYKNRKIPLLNTLVMLHCPTGINEAFAKKIINMERLSNHLTRNVNSWSEKEKETVEYNVRSFAKELLPEKAEIAEFLIDNPNFARTTHEITQLLRGIDNISEIMDLCKNYLKYEMTVNQVIMIMESRGGLSVEGVKKLNRKFGVDKVEKMNPNDRKILSDFYDIIDVKNINEITMSGKRKFLRKLVDSKSGTFNVSPEYADRLPILPKTLDEYCPIVRDIVRAVGIETAPLTPEQRIRIFNKSMNDLSGSLKILSDTEFAGLKITQEYSREDFINIVKEKLKDLSELEKRKVFDYFGFEIHHNRHNTTGYTLTGYPADINNGKKLSEIENPKTKAVIEELRPEVIKFSKNNKIKCSNPKVEALLNDILDGLPEIRTMIGRAQHCKYSPIKDAALITSEISSSPEFREVLYILNKKLNMKDIKNLEIKYENGKVICNNKTLAPALTKLIEKYPELTPELGLVKTGSHDFDVMQHSLKVMQKLVQDPKFDKLSESDKKIMLLASLLHDITKSEGFADKTHTDEGSFDAFYISKKFNLTQDECIKLYTLIKHHEWLGYVNSQRSEEALTKALQSVAYDLQNDNLFELSLMFTHADLKAVRKDDSFHDKTEGASRRNFRGEVHSFGQAADIHAARIREYVTELKKTKPYVPITNMPSASRIRAGVSVIRADGTTDIPGVYIDAEGHVIIKFNELKNEYLEKIGFPKGSKVTGIKAVGQRTEKNGTVIKEEIDTGNITFCVHGLDYENQLAKFDAFALPDSEVLLSFSYAERVRSKWKFFREQGVIPRFKNKYIHAGGESDSGSGTAKFVSEIKKNYVFGGRREGDRTYVADHIKKATGMSDEEYMNYVEQNQDKSHQELEPETSMQINQELSMINSKVRGKGDREYDEFLGSNAEMLQGTFAWDRNGEPIGNAVEYVNNNMYRLGFLRKYDLKNDCAMWLFGN